MPLPRTIRANKNGSRARQQETQTRIYIYYYYIADYHHHHHRRVAAAAAHILCVVNGNFSMCRVCLRSECFVFILFSPARARWVGAGAAQAHVFNNIYFVNTRAAIAILCDNTHMNNIFQQVT